MNESRMRLEVFFVITLTKQISPSRATVLINSAVVLIRLIQIQTSVIKSLLFPTLERSDRLQDEQLLWHRVDPGEFPFFPPEGYLGIIGSQAPEINYKYITVVLLSFVALFIPPSELCSQKPTPSLNVWKYPDAFAGPAGLTMIWGAQTWC